MNNDEKRIFAVLAVLAMAFAGFIVISGDEIDADPVYNYDINTADSVTVYPSMDDYDSKTDGQSKTLWEAATNQAENQVWALKAGVYNTTYKVDDKNCGSIMVIKQSITIIGTSDDDGNPTTTMYADYSTLASEASSADDNLHTSNDMFAIVGGNGHSVTIKNLKIMPIVYTDWKYQSEFPGYIPDDQTSKWYTPNCAITTNVENLTMENVQIVPNTLGVKDISSDLEVYMLDDGGNLQTYFDYLGTTQATTQHLNLKNFTTYGGIGVDKVNTVVSMDTVTFNFGIDYDGDGYAQCGDQRVMKFKTNDHTISFDEVKNVEINLNSVDHCRSNATKEIQERLLNNVYTILPSGVTININCDVELTSDITIPAGVTLNLSESSTLIVNEDVKIINNGAVVMKGDVENNGAFINYGTLEDEVGNVFYGIDAPGSVTKYNSAADYNDKKNGQPVSLREALNGQADDQYWEFEQGYYNVTKETTSGSGIYASAMVITTSVSLIGDSDEGRSATTLYADYANGAGANRTKGGWTQNELISCNSPDGKSVSIQNMNIMPLVYLGKKYGDSSDEKIVGYEALLTEETKWYTPNCAMTYDTNLDLKNVNFIPNILGTNIALDGYKAHMMDDAGNCQNFVIEKTWTSEFPMTITMENVVSYGGFSFNKQYANISMTNVKVCYGGSGEDDLMYGVGDQRLMKVISNPTDDPKAKFIKMDTVQFFIEDVVTIGGVALSHNLATSTDKTNLLTMMLASQLNGCYPANASVDIFLNADSVVAHDITVPKGFHLHNAGKMTVKEEKSITAKGWFFNNGNLANGNLENKGTVKVISDGALVNEGTFTNYAGSVFSFPKLKVSADHAVTVNAGAEVYIDDIKWIGNGGKVNLETGCITVETIQYGEEKPFKWGFLATICSNSKATITDLCIGELDVLVLESKSIVSVSDNGKLVIDGSMTIGGELSTGTNAVIELGSDGTLSIEDAETIEDRGCMEVKSSALVINNQKGIEAMIFEGHVGISLIDNSSLSLNDAEKITIGENSKIWISKVNYSTGESSYGISLSEGTAAMTGTIHEEYDLFIRGGSFSYSGDTIEGNVLVDTGMTLSSSSVSVEGNMQVEPAGKLNVSGTVSFESGSFLNADIKSLSESTGKAIFKYGSHFIDSSGETIIGRAVANVFVLSEGSSVTLEKQDSKLLATLSGDITQNLPFTVEDGNKLVIGDGSCLTINSTMNITSEGSISVGNAEQGKYKIVVSKEGIVVDNSTSTIGKSNVKVEGMVSGSNFAQWADSKTIDVEEKTIVVDTGSDIPASNKTEKEGIVVSAEVEVPAGNTMTVEVTPDPSATAEKATVQFPAGTTVPEGTVIAVVSVEGQPQTETFEVKFEGVTVPEGSKVKITVPFAAPAGASGVKVYYVNGTERELMETTYDTSSVSFTTSHNSEYEVVVEYTVIISAGTGGAVDKTSVAVPSGTTYSVSGNVLTINTSPVTSVTATSASGYVFSAWSSASGTISSNITLSASFVKTYTVTFNPNGGSVTPTSKTVVSGSTYGDLPTPSKSGYSFDGWYTAVSGGTKIVSTTTVSISADQTLYAHWSSSPGPTPPGPTPPTPVITYTLTFEAGSGGSVSPETVKAALNANITANGDTMWIGTGTSAKTVKAVPNDGYTVGTWSVTSGKVTSDMTITVTFKKVSLAEISVKTAPTKISYKEGEKFDPAGLTIQLTYDDMTFKVLPYSGNESQFSFSPSLATPLKTSDKTVTITFEGKSTTQAITVSGDSPSGGNDNTVLYVVIAALVVIFAAGAVFYFVKKKPAE